MEREESIRFAYEIESRISENALYAKYPQDLHGETAVDYVIERLSEAFLLRERAGEGYIEALKSSARELDPADIENDPFVRSLQVRQAKRGRFTLTWSAYERGELLQYEMPELSAPVVLPKIGFYPRRVEFPTICEGSMAWMSICPSEMSSLQKPIRQARGRVLTLGCGLGYYPFMICDKDAVESVTIIEREQDVIDLFRAYILPGFPRADKIHVIKADAFEYVRDMPEDMYDMCFADIWEGPEDGAAAYIRLKELARKHPMTAFSYWIEEEIRQWLLIETE